MPRIVAIEIVRVDLQPKVSRSDAIQSFVTQETPIVRITADDGSQGTGYSYTIGTGGSSVVSLLADHLGPQLLGRDVDDIESIWKDLFFHTHATAVGAITALALAAIDTALWDLRGRRLGLPLWRLAGGAQPRVPVYSTEGGWLQLDTDTLVRESVLARQQGFRGVKIKVGKPHVSEDVARLRAVREAVGSDFEIMTDANQCFDVAEAIRRARHFEALDIAWFEEPLPAEDLGGHVRLAASTSLPIAVGESIYSLQHFREYLQRQACSIVQADVARIGGITPWLKVAHLAESFNVAICPHFLMELHVSLTAATPAAKWVEYIPQLDSLTRSRIRIEDGMALAPDAPGNGIDWDWTAIEAQAVSQRKLRR
jgi:L-alanine-DL-glutamate epimerase-like enolase superfamily enzyme